MVILNLMENGMIIKIIKKLIFILLNMVECLERQQQQQDLTTLTINSTEASGSTYNAFDDKQVKGMANAQTEHAKRYMFNSTNQVMRRMEQFRRTGVHKSTGLRDLRLALNNNQRSKDQDVTSDLLDYYVKEYISNNGGGGKDFDLKINNWAFGVLVRLVMED